MGSWRKILLGILTVVLGVAAAAIVALHSSVVQTGLCRKAASVLSEKIDGEVSVGKVTIVLPGMVLLKDVCITQENPQDTVLSVGKIFADVRTLALLRGDLLVRQVKLEDGLLRLRNVNDSTTNVALLLAPLASQQEEQSEESFLKRLSARRVMVKNFAFSRSNPFASDSSQARPDVLDFNDIDVTGLSLDVRGIRYGKEACATIRNVSFAEKCGFELQRLEADVALDSTGLRVTDFYLQDAHSRVQAPLLALGFRDFADFGDLMHKVSLDIDLTDIHFDGRTLSHFVGLDLPVVLDATAKASGPVSDLNCERFKIFSESHKTVVDLTARVKGLPDLKTTYLDARIVNCQTNTADVASVLHSANPSFNKSSISKFAPGETVSFKGRIHGKAKDFVADGNLSTTSMGDVRMDMRCDNQGLHKVGLEGSLKVNELNLGGILGVESLGRLTCSASVDGRLGKEILVNLDSVQIAHFDFNGYDYRGIMVDGVLTDKQFDGSIFCADPNLDFSFKGIANFAPQENEDARYKFDLNLKNADLHALNFDGREVSKIALKADADIDIAPDGNLRGEAHVTDIVATLAEGACPLEDITLRAYFAENRYLMALNSGFAKLRYRGSASIVQFIDDAVNVAGRTNLNNLLGNPKNTRPGDYRLTLTTRDLRNICSFFAPGLYVSDSTVVDLQLAQSGVLTGLVKSDILAYNDNYIKDLRLDIANPDTLTLRVDGNIDLIQSGDIEIKNNVLGIDVANNTVNLSYAFDNGAQKQTMARVFAAAEFCDKDSRYDIIGSILPSQIVVSDLKWDLSPAKVMYNKEEIKLDNFLVSSGEQFIKLDGTLSANPSDTVLFRINKLDASSANALLGDMGFKGIVDARGEAIGVLGGDFGLQLDLTARGLGFQGSDIGDLSATSAWNTDEKRFDIDVRNTLAEECPLALRGYYTPSDKTVYLGASLKEFGLSWLSPLLAGLVSDVKGSVSGDILASGPLSNLEIKSSGTRLNRLGATLDYTQVPYVFDGPFTVGSMGVRFTDVNLYDKFGHNGKVTGTVDYDHFNDIRLNTRIRLENMQALNTKAKDNSSFYGTAFATGSVSLKGPIERIGINIRATTEGNTSVQIPLGGSSELKTSMLTFVNNRRQLSVLDSLRVSAKAKAQAEQAASGESELDVDVQITATPEATIQLVVDPSSGDAVKARGSGKVDIQTGPSHPLSLNGLYVIDEGSYHLSLLGIVSKDFTINSGSKVTLNGDIMDTDLDLTANYRTKASISTLVADSTSVGSRRYVDCGIKVGGKLENPQISFDIDIPDLDPNTKSMVDAALNTEEKRMQQALALLVSGSFVPDDQSGIVNNTTILYSNASEIMSNQLNNILQQLNIPIDFGFNYQPTDSGTNLFDVAISTQLFNNRVTINGNIGNRQNLSSSRSDIVGDIDVQIKVNKSGDLRVNLFSHSADEYSNYIDQTQRNGVGVTFQKEFDTWGEFVRKTFWSKRRQQQYEEEQEALRRQEIARRFRARNPQLPAVTPVAIQHTD